MPATGRTSSCHSVRKSRITRQTIAQSLLCPPTVPSTLRPSSSIRRLGLLAARPPTARRCTPPYTARRTRFSTCLAPLATLAAATRSTVVASCYMLLVRRDIQVSCRRPIQRGTLVTLTPAAWLSSARRSTRRTRRLTRSRALSRGDRRCRPRRPLRQQSSRLRATRRGR